MRWDVEWSCPASVCGASLANEQCMGLTSTYVAYMHDNHDNAAGSVLLRISTCIIMLAQEAFSTDFSLIIWGWGELKSFDTTTRSDQKPFP